MRTTLTIDDDLAGIIKKRANQSGRSLKEVVNSVLRAGIAVSGDDSIKRERVGIQARDLGLRAGYDPSKFNQLVDELESEAYARKALDR